MKHLYDKSELAFALVLIGVYIVLQSLALELDRLIGIEYAASALLCTTQAAVILAFVAKNRLRERYGLVKPRIPARRMLCWIPLIILATRNFWGGLALNFTPLGTLCYLICMLAVGVVEELIFRGFLFRAMEQNDLRSAIIVSSVTFGIGHIVNLVNGSGMELAENLMQIVGAVAIGFLFVIILHRSGSLLPCIAAHSFINMSSAFAGKTHDARQIVLSLVMTAIAAAYAIFITKSTETHNA